ncbi:hypothetical protein COW36_22545 [bacterium (Candidatus Blackallbacteria) CG17_big_fil_post_rev_8_21_14_2_50_48_46]|uniref:NadR/Ttd14 AAA domain-containing protein n=1 Tax=bacterium (Candidatus Blackallbacteria) CG17_big_fil_post_rev_8_21_14_2_50_48_46 TaxID=2014261 RepID=A0A2M7FY67_9BACT|nr:MAG: hypothetical protein COW64_07315 [bacterium (Candidatus Blackallbacteria) CG18_big_fil_WC_8_21_14_2_50_49_26]PIW14159.1 MAG: hypothetical protein COW36_22545 [bacterium (Candidatus Blackallbacteria) CG17_big_fil_post_rev_8_21_14_2_50_48_46]PIW46700.1 MAG: hypothetical protein COW20_14820 [bacterium (Candidatus Blackallbacteria) CG13_big_fil_rev_8_21_14_2_50_49_14]
MSEIKKRWLIEGVAGTGKSSLIAQLKAQLKSASRKGKVFDEGQTFGELLEELKTHPSPEAHFWRMEQVMQALAGSLNLDYLILERFHPSYYVQFPLAEHFSRFDRQLAAWGFEFVLLDLPDQAFAERSLYCPEREAEGWSAGNIAWYGSEQKAIEAFQNSQARRREYANLSKMKVRILDTSAQNWLIYAKDLLDA